MPAMSWKFLILFTAWIFAMENTEVSAKNNEELCTICFEYVDRGKNIAKSAKCFHKFHVECISVWLKQKEICPNCREKINEVRLMNPDISMELVLNLADFKKNAENIEYQWNDEGRALQVHIELDEGDQQENQLVFGERNPQLRNQHQFSNIRFQPRNFLHQIREYFLIWLINVWKFLSFWSVVQTLILLAYFFVPKWAKILFPWIQALNVLAVIPGFISPSRDTPEKMLAVANYITAFNGIFLYHSVFPFIFSGFELGTGISCFWLFLIMMKLPNYDIFIDKITGYIYLWWSLVEIEVVLGKFLVPEWANWFVWMQFFQVVSLILNARKKYFNAILVSVLTSIVSYHSITRYVFTYYYYCHAVSWPWLYVLSTFIFPGWEMEYTWKGYAFWSVLWLLVEIGIIIAKIYVPIWSTWFDFMQGFNILGLLSIPLLKYKSSLMFFIVVTGLVSYHSVMAFLLSDTELFHAIFWPWFIFLFLLLLLHFFKQHG